MNLTKPEKLIGKFVDLELLQESHRESLREITKDENIWTYFPYKVMSTNFDSWFDKIFHGIEKDEQIVYAVRQKSDRKIVGSTRYYEISLKHGRLRIGHTFYKNEVRGTKVNPESKFLLLEQAFEKFTINRIEFTVDARHLHSRAAVKKLGAVEEGVLRQQMILEDGYIRDTVMFSIIRSDWPVLKEKLRLRLSKF